MKKTAPKKLALSRETLVTLNDSDARAILEAARGRADVDTGTCTCFTDSYNVCCA